MLNGSDLKFPDKKFLPSFILHLILTFSKRNRYFVGKVVFSCANMVIILFWEPNFTYFKIDNVIRKYLENHALSAYVYFNTKNTLHLAS